MTVHHFIASIKELPTGGFGMNPTMMSISQIKGIAGVAGVAGDKRSKREK